MTDADKKLIQAVKLWQAGFKAMFKDYDDVKSFDHVNQMLDLIERQERALEKYKEWMNDFSSEQYYDDAQAKLKEVEAILRGES